MLPFSLRSGGRGALRGRGALCGRGALWVEGRCAGGGVRWIGGPGVLRRVVVGVVAGVLGLSNRAHATSRNGPTEAERSGISVLRIKGSG